MRKPCLFPVFIFHAIYLYDWLFQRLDPSSHNNNIIISINQNVASTCNISSNVHDPMMFVGTNMSTKNIGMNQSQYTVLYTAPNYRCCYMSQNRIGNVLSQSSQRMQWRLFFWMFTTTHWRRRVQSRTSAYSHQTPENGHPFRYMFQLH